MVLIRERGGDLVRVPESFPSGPAFLTTESGSLKAWVGVGGSPESVARAAHYGLPLVLAIIGGDPRRFGPYIDPYRRALSEFGHAAQLVRRHDEALTRGYPRRGAWSKVASRSSDTIKLRLLQPNLLVEDVDRRSSVNTHVDVIR